MVREESTTQKVKQALKAAGYPDVSVTCGAFPLLADFLPKVFPAGGR